MKKVLIISNDHAYTYDLRKEVIAELLKKYEVYIVVPYGDKVELLKDMGCKHIDLPLDKRGTNPLTDLKLMKSYDSIIKKLKPDIILTYTIKPNIYGGMMAKKHGIPYMANITGLGTAVENPGILQKITLILYKIAFKKINCVFFQNEENMKFFKDRHICNSEYILLPGSGVNVEEYSYMEYPNSDVIKFLYIARLMKEKGIEEYIELAKRIKKRYSNIEFHILGNCNAEYEKLLGEMVADNLVIYHGIKPDVRPYIRECSCIIHPSYYPEGMSNVCLEAAACGRPVITTNRAGCRETVDNNISGYIVNIKDIEDLEKKTTLFIDLNTSQKINMGRCGRSKMEKEFSREIIVEKYLEQIGSV